MNAQSTSHSSILKGGTNHKVVKNSGQKNGETWQEFFARRSEEHSRTKEKESAADRTKRKQRADHASQGGAPGRKGARVFYWEEEDDGFRVRTPMGRDRASNEWSRYTRGRKRYDEFADEWDICTDFDSNDAFSSEESDNEAEDGFLGPTVLQKRDTATSLDIPLEPAEPVGKENGGKEATSSDIPPEPAEPVGEEVSSNVCKQSGGQDGLPPTTYKSKTISEATNRLPHRLPSQVAGEPPRAPGFGLASTGQHQDSDGRKQTGDSFLASQTSEAYESEHTGNRGSVQYA
ncbi:hypothetical protein EV363DRAFT_1458528 [Boletus edulis]|nr:hypothetical protein EV363DRAFT_1458528 [Boletus edulis]